MHKVPYQAPSPIAVMVKTSCPRCGEGRLFKGFLSLNKECSVCKLDLAFADSGDGPAIFIIFIVGFLVATAFLYVELTYQPPYWVHALLWLPMIMILSLLLLRPLKALMIVLQYKNDAHEGNID